MKEFKLNNKTAESIFQTTGMSVEEIANADVLTVDNSIQKQIDRKLTPAIELGGLLSRGSVYFMFDRFFTEKDINNGIASIHP